MNQPTATNTPAFSTQSSVDTRTHLQLFQTMLNIQPFNSELAFLARNIKVPMRLSLYLLHITERIVSSLAKHRP